MGKVTDPTQLFIGRVLWFRSNDAPPPIGSPDQYALAKLHPYVCTGIEQGAMLQNSRRYTWLFTTSDQFRGDGGCVIKAADKRGDNFWIGKDSFFKRYNCVILRYRQVEEYSDSDPAVVVNKVLVESLDAFGLSTIVFLPPTLSAAAPAYVPKASVKPSINAKEI